MMHQQFQPHEWPLRSALTRGAYDEAWFETMFMALDRLHDALSASCLGTVSCVAPDGMVGWLEDIIYTAQEAIVEIRAQSPGSKRDGSWVAQLESEDRDGRFELK
ncbi:MAG TPA: hypothetical protein VMT24_14830 [Aggregatilineaceae bacterium]|nr:hypothetical protein [Aggregatilineaceae bacterium]